MHSRGGFPSLRPSVQPIDKTISGTVKISVFHLVATRSAMASGYKAEAKLQEVKERLAATQ